MARVYDENHSISGINYDICETQAMLFEYAAKRYVFDNFVELYMKCDFCRRAMDTEYSRFQLETERECMDFILPEIGEQLVSVETPTISGEVAYWIGFVYRALYIRTEIPSKELIEKVPLSAMYGYYPGLHTVEENMQIDIICEDHKIRQEKKENNKRIER